MSGSLTRSFRALRLATPIARPYAARRPASSDAGDAGETSKSEASSTASGSGHALDQDVVGASSSSTPRPATLPSSSSPSVASPTSRSNPALTQTNFPLVLSHHPVPRASDSSASSRPDKPSPPSHTHINFPLRAFVSPPKDKWPERLGGNESAARERILTAATGMQGSELRALRKYTININRVTQMTKKGKIPSFTALVVVGSPARGLVGIGWGRGATGIKAMDQGFHKAVLNMDYVTRYENRTFWGTGADLTNKWGATKVIMRARPPGFGLMVPPMLHRVFTACGVKDASATIEGSRNEVEVVKCAIQMLHGGVNPPGFGSGLSSGRGRREDKGSGIRSKDEIERERGRYGVDIGRRV